MHRLKKLAAVGLCTATASTMAVASTTTNVAASGTGAGLAEYALNAYYEGWSYVWGGTEPGAVDCSGLIWSYCGGNRLSMLSDAQANGRDWGYVSDGIPRVHGLGLSRPNHVGVYIEDGMEVDARGSAYGVCYQQIGENGYNNWDCWFKLTAVDYPENGWETFNGNCYYYEDGEYIVDTSRTIDGTTYYFDSKGHSSTAPSSTSGSSSSGNSKSSSGSKSTVVKPTVWQKGSCDDEVVKIQTRLAELGYYDGEIDGDFGDMTDAAFRAFQKAAGLTVDGIAGSDREVLYSDNAPAKKVETVKETVEEPTEAPTEAPAPTEEVEEVEETQPAAEDEAAEEIEEEDIVSGFVMMKNGDFSDNVATVQSKLLELGYLGIEATGLYGDYTTEAVGNFQLANGLEMTGDVDSVTYEALFSDDAVASELPAAAEETAEDADEAYAEYAEDAEDAENTETYEADAEEAYEAAEAEAEDTYEEAPAAPAQFITPDSPVTASIGTPGKQYAATASKSVAKANAVTEKAMEKSADITPTANKADTGRTANIWIWLVLAAATLGVVAFIMLMHGKKRSPKKSKTSTKAQLNQRW